MHHYFASFCFSSAIVIIALASLSYAPLALLMLAIFLLCIGLYCYLDGEVPVTIPLYQPFLNPVTSSVVVLTPLTNTYTPNVHHHLGCGSIHLTPVAPLAIV